MTNSLILSVEGFPSVKRGKQQLVVLEIGLVGEIPEPFSEGPWNLEIQVFEIDCCRLIPAARFTSWLRLELKLDCRCGCRGDV